MYETENLIYVQLQKTGSTHIAKMLAEILNGSAPKDGPGKHSRATQAQINSGKTILASIRNPWDWYVSLWTFGCIGKGGLRNQALQKTQPEWGNSYTDWERVYSNKNDTDLFREWLRMVFNPTNAALIRYGPQKVWIPENVGFMTYRYARLCWQENPSLKSSKPSKELPDLLDVDALNCYVHDFIRLDQLEEDLCRVINTFRPLGPKEERRIHTAEPTNSSQRSHPLSLYYDQESIEAVRTHDALIIEKFGYKPPLAPHVNTP
jgi:hypothetical protein